MYVSTEAKFLGHIFITLYLKKASYEQLTKLFVVKRSSTIAS